ncbi:MAG: acyltransferase [Treponema sp.]|nr:acyltransferase [Treponema sp.]
MNTPSTNETRSHYLDNLKVALTVLVIAHHAMIPFVDGTGWPFSPSNPDESLPYMWHFLNTNAAFFMGLFFMISGYFVPKSFDRQGFGKFIFKKTLRLFVPFAVISAVISVATGTPESGHTWFLGTLFLFCLVYSIIRLVCKKSYDNPKPLSLIFVIVFAVIMSAGSLILRKIYNQDDWIYLWVYKFEPVHYLQYIMMFAFGVMAGRGEWFNKMSGATGCTSLVIGLLLCIGNYLRGDNAWSGFIYQWFGAYESLLCVFLCTGLIWLFRKAGNWSGRFWKWCAEQSFGAYIIHLFVLLIVENILDPIWLGTAGKYLSVLILATAGSFVISWLLRLIPGVKKVL